jgi:hypothetical protein
VQIQQNYVGRQRLDDGLSIVTIFPEAEAMACTLQQVLHHLAVGLHVFEQQAVQRTNHRRVQLEKLTQGRKRLSLIGHGSSAYRDHDYRSRRLAGQLEQQIVGHHDYWKLDHEPDARQC